MNNRTPQPAMSYTTRRQPKTLVNIWVVSLVCAMVAPLAGAGVSTIPILLSDDFDTGNTVGAAPAGWKVNAPVGTSVRVIDASTKEPASASNCVELVDNSPTGRAEMYRDFSPSESGRASAAFKMNSLSTGHSALILRGAKGGNLCSVILAGNGVTRYQREGGTTNSAASWAAGSWQTVQIEWFNDFTFNASLGATPVVTHAHFTTNALPGRISIIIGYDRATNRVGYVDDVTVLGAAQH